jgi:NAD(P)-dependent dehydrogenase (short-subunit alcohol dehydrogenase family)
MPKEKLSSRWNRTTKPDKYRSIERKETPLKENLKENMNGKICLVTGGTNGIGKATAQALAQMGATVVIVSRSPAKCAAVVSEIKHSSGNHKVEALVADLSSMTAVRQVAAQFKTNYQQLHVLVNNAGAAFGQRQITAEGFEKTFALNHLSSFLLTSLLLDTLKASAPARIVNVSSDAHKGAHLDFDDLQSEQGSFVFKAYGRSKLAVVVFSYELARRLSGTGVTANVLHPGLVRTGFASNLGVVPSAVIGFLMRFVGVTPAQGAQTSIYLATSPAVEMVTGKYWEKRKAVPSGRATYDEATWMRLWEVSEMLVAARATADPYSGPT